MWGRTQFVSERRRDGGLCPRCLDQQFGPCADCGRQLTFLVAAFGDDLCFDCAMRRREQEPCPTVWRPSRPPWVCTYRRSLLAVRRGAATSMRQLWLPSPPSVRRTGYLLALSREPPFFTCLSDRRRRILADRVLDDNARASSSAGGVMVGDPHPPRLRRRGRREARQGGCILRRSTKPRLRHDQAPPRAPSAAPRGIEPRATGNRSKRQTKKTRPYLLRLSRGRPLIPAIWASGAQN